MSLRPDVSGVGLSATPPAPAAGGLHVFGFMGLWISHAAILTPEPPPPVTEGGGSGGHGHFIPPFRPREAPEAPTTHRGDEELLALLAVMAIREFYDD